MNKFIKKYRKDILFTICIVVFLVIVSLLLNEYIEPFDNLIYGWISKLKCDFVTVLCKSLSFLCSTGFIILATLLFIVFNKNKKLSFYVALNLILCVALNQGLKFLFARDRPVDINLITENGYSFPSGHSMVSMAFYGFFCYLILHMNISKGKKIFFSSLLIILILLIGLSRIYLGVHFASDVLGGFTLSLAYLIIYVKIIYKKISLS